MKKKRPTNLAPPTTLLVKLPRELKMALRRLSTRRGLSMSEIVRRAIRREFREEFK